jgi:hypothetical protein
MSLALHEGKCCDAAIRELERRFGVTRCDLRSPELERAVAPVELTCRLGDQLFAIEHTGIEPFAGHMQLQAEGARDFEPVKEALAGLLPPDDFFDLHVPVGAMQSLPRGARTKVRAALVEWIKATGPTLPRSEIHRYTLPIVKVMPPGVPFEVTLHRHVRPAIFTHTFSVTHLVTAADQEEERRARLRLTCEKKFPKLAWWKRNAGARTVLVLEDNDMQLSNPTSIYQALATVEAEFDDRPDEVHLVSTFIESPWWLHLMRVDDRGYFELPDHTELEPQTLRDLMLELAG